MSYKSGIINNLISNELLITFPDEDCADIGEENIASESMTLKQSLCDDDELRFGGCVASEFSIKLINTAERQFTAELTGKWISVKLIQHYADPDLAIYPSSSLYPSSNLYPGKAIGEKAFYIFSGFIDSARADKTDKNVLDIVAYDALAKLYETDATDFLYSFFTESSGTYGISRLLSNALSSQYNHTVDIVSSGITLYFGETYLSNISVGSFEPVNDYWLSRKDKITFGNLIKSICELICVFGTMDPDSDKGKFIFKRLKGTAETYEFYEKLEAEDYQSTGYTDFQFSVSGNDRTGKSVLGGGLTDQSDGAVDKIYDFSENILIMQPYTSSGQGRVSTPFDNLVNQSSVGTRLAMNAESTSHTGQCSFSSYQPLNAALDGRLWVSVGDPIEILVNETTVDGDWITDGSGNIVKQSVKTYILSRTLTGIQALTDNIIAKGAR